MLRNWKTQKTDAALRADGVTRLFRRPFGARECNPARRAGATGMSPTCTVFGSAPHAKRPTEAVKLTRTALLENELENESKSSAGPASGRETPPEKRRGRLWGGAGSRERWRAADGRVERGVYRQDRAEDIRAMGHETMETHARVMPQFSEQRCSERRRSYEHRSSDKTSASPRGAMGPSRQGPHSRAHITSARIEQAMSRISRIKTRVKTGIKKCALARPPRKLLRVNGLGDKLGYLRATFVPPLIFLHQS
jgi:hypothetical protein